jgi:transcriptional regulator with PAS, ATPase and Fis domain
LAKDLISRGAKILISRKGTKLAIEKELNIQVIGIDFSLSDYIAIIEQARNIDGIVAFFSYGEPREDIKTMCYILGIKAKYYYFTNIKDSEESVLHAIEEGAKLGVGGATTDIYARKYGLNHITVENSQDSIISTINLAKEILHFQKEDEKKNDELKVRLERYETIFNYTHDAIIAINEQGKIDVLNKTAAKIIKSKFGTCIGKDIDNVIKNTKMIDVIKSGKGEINQIMNINGTMVTTNRIPIIVNNIVKGVVATFQDVKIIQDYEKNIRLNFHQNNMTLAAKYHFDDIVGKSKVIQDVIRISKKYAKSDVCILVYGETGTGKELFVQSIHNFSNRSQEPFVAVNCTTIPPNLFEAELFGYEEGTFTGATKGGKAGLFELAHRGTIFLDEIAEIPLDAQIKLLRVLQEKEIRRIGGRENIPIDIRVIAATNKNLREQVKNGKFREDLFYRLDILNVEIPPLRDRKEDIIDIAMYMFSAFDLKNCKKCKTVLKETLNNLKEYNWPGNIRELYNIVSRIYVLLSQGEEIKTINKIILKILEVHVNDDNHPEITKDNENNEQSFYVLEKNKIIDTLKKNNLTLNDAAKELNIGRTTLWRKMKKYNIKN